MKKNFKIEIFKKEISYFFYMIEDNVDSFINTKDLIKIKITRWRWDLPELMISWISNYINKNIIIFIFTETKILNIECNAWHDRYIFKNYIPMLEREWFNKNIKKKELFKNSENINESVELIIPFLKEAYQTVSHLKQKELINKKLIPLDYFPQFL